MEQTNNGEEITKNISTFTEVLTRFAGLAIILSGIAYYAGYQKEKTYLDLFGAEWAINLYSSFEFILAGLNHVVIIGISFALFVTYLMHSSGRKELLIKITIYSIIF